MQSPLMNAIANSARHRLRRLSRVSGMAAVVSACLAIGASSLLLAFEAGLDSHLPGTHEFAKAATLFQGHSNVQIYWILAVVAAGLAVLTVGRRQVMAAHALVLKRISSERGQALIEFAMLFPIILVFLLALVDFGMAMDQRQVIQHAVREGARHGAVNGNPPSSIITLTENQMDGLTVTVCYVDGPNGEPAGRAGSFVRVSGDFDYVFTLGSGELLNAFGVSGPLTINMTPSADERLEASVPGANECVP